MSFLSPFGALVVLVGVVPVVAFLRSERARVRVTRLLRLPEANSRIRLVPLVASVAIAALLGIAATQPTIASITDRVLPHLFPTTDLDTFDLTVHKVIGIERPPPADSFSTRITTLGSIARVVSGNFFDPTATKRLLVVFTDGETKPFTDASIGTVFRQPPGVHSIFVRIWGAHERVYHGRTKDPLYRPDPMSAVYIRQLAATAGGTAVESTDFGRLLSTARADLGQGPTRVLGNERRQLALAPYLAALCFLPLGFVLWRRNV